MRIVQIIDSLDAGGAERMAVNLANVLSKEIAFSGLIATRKEGLLKESIYENVSYFFSNRKQLLDVSALKEISNYVKANDIQIIHAHATSWFVAVLIKFLNPKCKLIWHDHYGNSEFLDNRPYRLIRLLSYKFDGIISVNDKLKKWAIKRLRVSKIVYLSNFFSPTNTTELISPLFGVDGKRIICLANLRPQKGHHFLLNIAKEIIKDNPEWTFHLIGENSNKAYLQEIQKRIVEENLSQNVFIYGSRIDIGAILNASTIGILTSASEGLPLAMLEYGFFKLPVIVTAVGEIPNVISNENEGIVVPYGQTDIFVKELQNLINFPDKRKKMGEIWSAKCYLEYGAQHFLKKYLSFINEIYK